MAGLTGPRLYLKARRGCVGQSATSPCFGGTLQRPSKQGAAALKASGSYNSTVIWQICYEAFIRKSQIVGIKPSMAHTAMSLAADIVFLESLY